jgi:EmrB/QacA subfamily drug resistance transporter
MEEYSRHYRIIPLIVACPLFLQNLDTSVMATALPSIARSLDVETLHLNLAITCYLLSLALFLPASGWLSERFGPKRVFCGAILFFTLGSALCGASQSLSELVLFRIIQGIGGALMVPVARLILLRSIPPARMVSAMIWFTVPGGIGRMAGPLFGGAIVTVMSWRWIFLVNIPFGLLGIALAMKYVEERREPSNQSRDLVGFALTALTLVGLVGGLETAGRDLVPDWVTIAMLVAGTAGGYGYHRHSQRNPDPLIDMSTLRYTTFRASVLGGMPLRIAVGASPFMLPLMLQLGFGLSALTSGLLTVATAIGALCTRTVMATALRTIGFRRLLIGATFLTSLSYMAYGQFSPTTSHVMIFCTLLIGGLFNSLGMVGLNTLGYSEIPKPKMSHATTLATMAQQLSISLGVAIGASLLSLTAWARGHDIAHLGPHDFMPAFVAVGCITLISLFFFWPLSNHEGDELLNRR